MPVDHKKLCRHRMTGLEQVYLEGSPVWMCHGQSPHVSSVDQWTVFVMVAYFDCVDITVTMYLFEPPWMLLSIIAQDNL